MPAPTVRADYDALNSITQQFSQACASTRQGLETLKGHVATLQGGDWVGQGATKFYAEMSQSVLPAMQRLVNALDRAAVTTGVVRQLFRQTEDEAARFLHGGDATVVREEIGAAWLELDNIEEEKKQAEARAADLNLKQTVADAVKKPNVRLADLKAAIAAATPAGREAVWKDTALMARLKAKMSTQEYLDLLPALRVHEQGRQAQASAAEVDSMIQRHLRGYVANAVKLGRKADGSAAVVGQADWDAAGKAHYGANWDSKRNTLGGFVDHPSQRIWVHKDRGNPGTMIHEGIHKYSALDMNLLSQPLNEGVTEYFTRDVISKEGIRANRTSYQENFKTVQALAVFVGEGAVAKAYFDGDMAGLKTAYLAKGKTEADWNNFITRTKNGQWEQAKLLLK